MTLPSERTRAVLQVEQFLIDLRDPKKYQKVPKEVRNEAHGLLKYYPSRYNMTYIDDSFEPLEDLNYDK